MGQDDATSDSTDTAPATDNTTAREEPESGRREGPPALPNRYIARDLPQQNVVIYDHTNTQAWIQSDYAVPLPGDTSR
jgi:hypothetical protein